MGTSYVSSFDPLGCPFVYVNMFDPTCVFSTPASGSSRGNYAVLVQVPYASDCPWRLPAEMATWLDNYYRDHNCQRSCFSENGNLANPGDLVPRGRHMGKSFPD